MLHNISTNMSGWGFAPSVEWRNRGLSKVHAPGCTATFPKRTDAAFLEDG